MVFILYGSRNTTFSLFLWKKWIFSCIILVDYLKEVYYFMKIMSINAGSSSLKFSLFNMDNEEVIASGLFERIGIDQSAYTIKYNGEKIKDITLRNGNFELCAQQYKCTGK